MAETKVPVIPDNKCGASKESDRARFPYRCLRKKGHTGEHVDMRAIPTYRWKEDK